MSSTRPLTFSIRPLLGITIALVIIPTVADAWDDNAFPFTYPFRNRFVGINELPGSGNGQDITIDWREEIPFAVYIRGGQGGNMDQNNASAYGRRRRAIENKLGPAGIDIVSSGWGASAVDRRGLIDIAGRCRNYGIRWFYDLYDGPNFNEQTTDTAYGLKNFNDSVGLGKWIHADDSDLLFPINGTSPAGANIDTLYAK